MAAPRILILTASIGEGHDGPARVLVAGIRGRRPDADVEVVDGLRAMGPLLRTVAGGGAAAMSYRLRFLLDAQYLLFGRFAPLRGFGKTMLGLLGARGLARLVAETRPDVIVSTYPGCTEVLGRMRRRGRVDVPTVSVITDLAAMHYWAARGVDVHLIIHPETADEVGRIAGETKIVTVRGLYEPAMLEPIDRAAARGALGLPAGGRVVAVSGGGWGVGDLAGAAQVALAEPEAFVVVLCGRNERLRARLERRFGTEPRVRVTGFTEQMSEHLAAADVLIHSSAGLTVLEGLIRGCAVISYGWDVAHVRVNNRAYERYGMVRVARSRRQLAAELPEALAVLSSRDEGFAALPDAADVVLDLTGRRGPSAPPH
jgi:processive 1,2-diacylglycerol beta-glucosyltransferase